MFTSLTFIYECIFSSVHIIYGPSSFSNSIIQFLCSFYFCLPLTMKMGIYFITFCMFDALSPFLVVIWFHRYQIYMTLQTGLAVQNKKRFLWPSNYTFFVGLWWTHNSYIFLLLKQREHNNHHVVFLEIPVSVLSEI